MNGAITFPFSRDDFLSVFVRYNERVWPVQVVLFALAIIAVFFAFRRSATGSRTAHAVLALLWLWMGLVYHAGFFSEINPAAFVFAVMFVVEAGLFALLAVGQKTVVFVPRRNLAGSFGGVLICLGLVVYPLLSLAAGHHYPAQPTFGLPCPTTIFTFGLLLWAFDSIPWRVFVIPVLWAAIGTLGAIQLGMTEDFLLPVSVAIVAFLWIFGKAVPHAPALKSRLGAIRWS